VPARTSWINAAQSNRAVFGVSGFDGVPGRILPDRYARLQEGLEGSGPSVLRLGLELHGCPGDEVSGAGQVQELDPAL
jgi:hypothetical protein